MTPTGGLGHVGLAVGIFLVSHSLTTLPAFRRPAERLLGKAGFTIAYSVLSLLLLTWAVAATLAAPYVPLWERQAWMHWVPPLVMPFACVLAMCGMTSANPFSIGPGAAGFDPARPGILRLTRHPVLVATSLWAAAHIVANGSVAALMLFGPLLALALVGPRLLDTKRRRTLGKEEWDRLAVATSGHPQWSALLREVGMGRIAAGLALYALLIPAHAVFINIWPIP
jgi:uncharacterized membrane protein